MQSSVFNRYLTAISMQNDLHSLVWRVQTLTVKTPHDTYTHSMVNISFKIEFSVLYIVMPPTASLMSESPEENLRTHSTDFQALREYLLKHILIDSNQEGKLMDFFTFCYIDIFGSIPSVYNWERENSIPWASPELLQNSCEDAFPIFISHFGGLFPGCQFYV